MGLAPLMLDLLWVFALATGILASIVTGFLMQVVYREKRRVRLLDLCFGLLAALCAHMSLTLQGHQGRGRFEQLPRVFNWAEAHPFWAGVIAAFISVSLLYAVQGYLKLRRSSRT